MTQDLPFTAEEMATMTFSMAYARGCADTRNKVWEEAFEAGRQDIIQKMQTFLHRVDESREVPVAKTAPVPRKGDTLPLDTPIKSLDLSSKIQVLLKQNGVKIAKDLAKLDRDQLTGVGGTGSGTIKALHRRAIEASQAPSAQLELPVAVVEKPPLHGSDGEQPHDRSVKDIGLPNSVAAKLWGHDIRTVGQLVGKSADDFAQMATIKNTDVAIIEEKLSALGLSLKQNGES